MATIKQVFNNFEKLDFYKVVEETMYQSEKDIIYLNVNQMQDGKGSNDGILKNNNKKFKGVYTEYTQEIASNENPILPKSKGDLYNFGYTGDFLNNLELTANKLDYVVFSTGTGVGDKKTFFDGYDNMFGLNKESREELIEGKGFGDKLIKNIKNVVRL
jgi:hypothetical protein